MALVPDSAGPKNPLRWLFVERESNELTALTYSVFGVVVGLLIFAMLSVMWPRAMKLYTDAQYKDWITQPHPDILSEAGKDDSPFRKALDDLASRVDQVTPGATGIAPLADAASIGAGGTPCDQDRAAGSTKRSYGEVVVFPSCVSYSFDSDAKKEQRVNEKAVFESFSRYIVGEYAKHLHDGDLDPNHIERTLARVIGLSAEGKGTSFDVPWVYVASNTGSIAVFPGTTVIAEPDWKTSSRPWWQQTFQGQTHLGSEIPWHPGDRLTVTYLDVLTNTPTYVRTYLRKSNSQAFVIAVDLSPKLDEPLRPMTILGADLIRPTWQLLLGIGLVFSLLLFIVIRWISPAAQETFVLERRRSIYGNVTRERLLSFLSDDESNRATGIEGRLGKYVVATIKEERKRRVEELNRTKAGTSILCRGFEEWTVIYQRYRSWRLLWRFAHISRSAVGITELTYGGAVLPKAEWLFFNKQLFLKSDEDYYKWKLLEVLQLNADSCDESLDLPAKREQLESFAVSGKVPDYVLSAIVEPQKLSAVRQRRAYLTLDDSKLTELYNGATNVSAVILYSYFGRLFETQHTAFLSKGRQIMRLVLFPSEDIVFSLGNQNREEYRELQTSSRTLKRVNATLNEGRPVYDFAIIEIGSRPDDKLLIVTTDVSEAKFIDRVLPREGATVYRVDCYLSWRPSDLRFYESIFDELSSKAVDLEGQPTGQYETA